MNTCNLNSENSNGIYNSYVSVWGGFFFKFIKLNHNVYMLLSCTSTWFLFRFFFDKCKKVKWWGDYEARVYQIFLSKILGFSEKLLLQLHAIQFQDFVSNKVKQHFNQRENNFFEILIQKIDMTISVYMKAQT